MPAIGGSALSAFTNFVTLTGKHTVDPGQVLVETMNRTYLLGRFLKGKDANMVVKSGATLNHVSQLTEATQFEFYNPNATFTYAIENLDAEMTWRWRFAHDVWVYTDQELELNKQGAQFEQVYDLMESKRIGCKLSTYNGMEEALWTTPSTSTMEAATGTRPYSIRAFITEDGGAPAGFTLLAGLNPATYSKYKNQVTNYTTANINTELIPAFDDMIRKVNFEAPGSLTQYIHDTRFQKFIIATDINGDKKYAQLTRDSNDRLQGGPGGQRDLGYVNQGANVFRGIPVTYVHEIDLTVGYASTQPRFFWINTDYLFPVFHTKAYVRELEPMRSPSQPYTWVVHTDTWYNLICTSRNRQGIIVPV
jgi:hypothetical protein